MKCFLGSSKLTLFRENIYIKSRQLIIKHYNTLEPNSICLQVVEADHWTLYCSQEQIFPIYKFIREIWENLHLGKITHSTVLANY